MAVTTTKTNKPFSPRGNDQSPLAYNRAKLYSGKALDFDGVNDKVDCGTLDITDYTGISVSMYFNADTVTSVQILFSLLHSGGDDIRLVAELNGFTYAIDDGTLYQFATPINANEWYFAVLTFDGSTLKGYLNGQEVGSIAASFDFSTADGKLILGERFNGTFDYDGEISNTRIFNTALTAAQVSDLYNNPEKVVPTGVDNTALKLWLPMMEGAGTTAYDGSGNGNHGTISGATYVNGVGAPVSQSAVIDWNKTSNIVQNTDISDLYWSAGSQVTRTGDQESVSGLYNSATLIEDTTTNAAHWAGAAVTTSASTTYIQAAFLKKKDSGIYASLRTNGVGPNAFVVFDFDTASIVGVGSDIDDYGVVSFANGWYRVWMKYTLAPSGIIIGVSNSTSEPIPSYAGTGIGFYADFPTLEAADEIGPALTTTGTAQTSPVLLPQGLTSGRDITGVNLFENVRKQGALNLDGNSWAEVHDNASLDFGTGSFTLEAWVKADFLFQGSSVNTILSLGGDITDANTSALVSASSNFAFWVGGISRSTPNYVPKSWNHIVGVRSGSSIIFYFNGSQVSTGTNSSLTTNSEVKQIGRDTNTIRQYNDQIAQPRIYNRALTAEEVQRNYNAGKNTYTN